VPALTGTEAQARAALLTVRSYDVSLDLTVTPARSRTVIRFDCARPGADSFADLTARVAEGGATLNGVPPGPAGDGRLALAGLAARNVLTVDAEIPETARRHYERELAVPCPYREHEVVALPDVPFRAACVPGLILVSEDLLARLADPDDDFAGMVTAHEVAHFWFGCLVGMRWWDDLWLEEALATYLSYWTDAGWTSFAYGQKPRALRADELPTTQPVSSPVATMDQAVSRPNAITYVKGTAVIRQLAALIGADTVTRGLTDYLARFAPAGSASLDDLVACWSRASGRDLTGWAEEWLRTSGTPRLAVRLPAPGDAATAALTVTQDLPRPHRVGVALYDRARSGDGQPCDGLRHRGTRLVELAGAATRLPGRAVTAADRYVPRAERPAVRTVIADAALRAAQAPPAAAPLRRALLAGFAASAETDAHLAAVRVLLDGDPELTLRAALLLALATRGLAGQPDLAVLTAADPVAGQPFLAACEAARPDPAAKEAAWTAALDERTPQFLARAHAGGIWITGQEHLLAGYRDRYFTQALAVLSARDARGERRAPRLAGLLFPATFDDESTLASVAAALAAADLTGRLRAVLQEQEAELRTAITVKAMEFPA
jgi:Peptidase family M1 domain